MNFRRLISGGRSLHRLLCTEAMVSELPAKKPKPYQCLLDLLELEKTGKSVSETLEACKMEGKPLGKEVLENCIKELRKSHRFHHALEIMEWMGKTNFPMHNHALHLNLVYKVKGVVEAENYFNCLPPAANNKYTYGSLLNCYCLELMADKALAHFDKMNELGYLVSLSFTNLMSMYMKLGYPLKVSQLVSDMKQMKLPMTRVIYNIWMNSCASLNDLAGVQTVYQEMIKVDEYKTHWGTYSNLAAIYVKADQLENAELMLRKVEEVIKPHDREAYHFLLTHYGEIGNLNEVYSVWESLKAVSPVTNQSYYYMLSTLRRLNDMKGIIKYFEEWESSFVTFDRRLIGFAVNAYLSQNMDEEAALVFKDAMGRCEKGSFFWIREMFMVHFLEKGQLDGALSHLEAVLSEVKEIKWHPSPQVVSAFLKYYEEKTDLDSVDEFCKIFKTSVVRTGPNQTVQLGTAQFNDWYAIWTEAWLNRPKSG